MGYTESMKDAIPQPITPRETPSNVEAVLRLLNTLDVENGVDRWSDAASTTAWLSENDQWCGDLLLTDADVIRLRTFREALRDFVDYGEELPAASRAVLEQEMDRCPLRLTFSGQGGQEIRFECAGNDADTPISTTLIRVREAQLAGTWRRLKICREHSCRAAYYDHSKNASATWCSMQVCGNRNKARRFRSKNKPETAAS